MVRRTKNRKKGEAYIRSECLIEGCTKLQRNKGRGKTGDTVYCKLCNVHHRKLFNIKDVSELRLPYKKIKNDKCTRCGWSEASCDRHRKKPELGYVPENVVVLCPNCHRLVSFGIITI